MIKYWPDKPGIKLNNAVVNLFIATYQKLKDHLYNKTYLHLYTDILDNKTKCKLLTIILKELESLILDITELNLSINELNKLEHQILNNFIHKSSLIFINKTSNKMINLLPITKHAYNQLLLDENLLIKPLLIYLIFGASYVDENIFIFNKNKTPSEHVIILFENFLIQVSDSIIYKILNNLQSLEQIISFFRQNNLCNNNYISARSISLFMNQILLQNYLRYYIYQPKIIYSARYQVLLLSSEGIISKYIYLLRLTQSSTIPKSQYFIFLFIEILDLIIPKIEKFLLKISKYIIYIFMNFLGNIIVIIIRILITYLNK